MTASSYSFAAIVRTQGKRMDSLAEALESLSFQRPACLAVVVVHASESVLSPVDAVCRSVEGLNYVLCHAKDTGKKRGYPLNVGLDYCYQQEKELSALLFLDDDDIIYPFFTRKTAQALAATGGDVVYAASNLRRPGQFPEPAYRPVHIAHLFIENFIPINSYAIRFSRLRKARLLFDEDLDYTEDWHFLLRLLEKGFRFEPLHDTLSEFRITSDGNTTCKKHPEAWKQASLKIRAYINRTQFSVSGHTLASAVMSESADFSYQKNSPEPLDIRAVLLWQTARNIWHRLPSVAQTAITRAYRYYVRKSER